MFELVSDDGQFFDGVVVGIIPPVIFPVGGSTECFLAESDVILSSFDLDTVSVAVLVLAKAAAFLPAHAFH